MTAVPSLCWWPNSGLVLFGALLEARRDVPACVFPAHVVTFLLDVNLGVGLPDHSSVAVSGGNSRKQC